MEDQDEFRVMFFTECDELLERLASGLRELDGGSPEADTIHSVFRAVHSIKGGAAAFALNELVGFAHRFETLLDDLRCARLEATTEVLSLLHRSSDFLTDLVNAAALRKPVDSVQYNDLMEQLSALIITADEGEPLDFMPLTLSFGDETSNEMPLVDAILDQELSERSFPVAMPTTYQIIFAPSAELYRSGNEPVALLRDLARLGELHVVADVSAIPLLSNWSVDLCSLRWSVSLSTSASEADISAVFEFVDDCCILFVTRKEEHIDEHVFAGLQEPEEKATAPLQAEALSRPPVSLTEVPSAEPAKVPLSPQESGVTIRVNLDRVDRLMNMIGELVIKEAILSQLIEKVGLSENVEVAGGLDGIRQLADEIQDSVMAIRAQPLKLVFQRMFRICREAADATGKNVRLLTLGEQTEVDKTMIERLIDPLTHMIRNSVDHGIEDELLRKKRGKPAVGTITLTAGHRSGRVLIEVSDDGGGIDRERVRAIAEEKGLIAVGAPLSPVEIDQLLFLPGFSSKKDISALSGRGVGLDVVRREIMSLGGRVTITSQEGRGTTFSIALPLTLAVLEGMLIQLGDQTMVVPIASVQETLKPTNEALHHIGPQGRAVLNRGDLVPIIDMGRIFGIRETCAPIDQGVMIVVETDSHKRAALHVDGIIDQRQVVIKSLEKNYGRVVGVSAATILGDGNVALIVDPEEIVLISAHSDGPSMLLRAENG